MRQRAFLERFQVKPGRKVRLKDFDPDYQKHPYRNDPKLKDHLAATLARLAELEVRLYAEAKQSLLIVLQALDAGGKDGTIRRVFSGLNPQSCRVASFKRPSSLELRHDFLWRIHEAVPGKGEIGIFNRSHYEDVLVVRVHKLVPPAVWRKRYRHINNFEEHLVESGTQILKFFLHISKEEQRQRLQARLDDPEKHWKIEASDFEERRRWDDYQEAFEDALGRCSTPWAPWYVIPANRRWLRDWAVAQILVDKLEQMNPQFPPPKVDVSKLKLR